MTLIRIEAVMRELAQKGELNHQPTVELLRDSNEPRWIARCMTCGSVILRTPDPPGIADDLLGPEVEEMLPFFARHYEVQT